MKHIVKVTAALALVAGLAHAQTFTPTASNVAPTGKRTELVGTLTSATTPRAVAVNPYENVFVSCVGSAASTSQTVIYATSAGRVLETASVNCTTSAAIVVSRTANFGASLITISPTAGLTGTNVVTNTIVTVPTPSAGR